MDTILNKVFNDLVDFNFLKCSNLIYTIIGFFSPVVPMVLFFKNSIKGYSFTELIIVGGIANIIILIILRALIVTGDIAKKLKYNNFINIRIILCKEKINKLENSTPIPQIEVKKEKLENKLNRLLNKKEKNKNKMKKISETKTYNRGFDKAILINMCLGFFVIIIKATNIIGINHINFKLLIFYLIISYILFFINTTYQGLTKFLIGIVIRYFRKKGKVFNEDSEMTKIINNLEKEIKG